MMEWIFGPTCILVRTIAIIFEEKLVAGGGIIANIKVSLEPNT
jgi:hypothetical protein